MSFNSELLLETSELPISIIPALNYQEQLEITTKFIDSSIKSRDSSQLHFFPDGNGYLRKEYLDKIFSNRDLIDGNYFWFQGEVGCLLLKQKDLNLFSQSNRNLIFLIREKLILDPVLRWIIVLSFHRSIIFSISKNHFLIWSPLIEGLELPILMSFIVKPEFLVSINEQSRWESLEQGKKYLTSIINTLLKKDQIRRPITNTSSIFLFLSKIIILYQCLMLDEIKRLVTIDRFNLEGIEKIKGRLSEFNLNQISPVFAKRRKEYSKIDLEEKHIIKLVFDLLENLDYRKILGIYPINLLEIFPSLFLNEEKRDGVFYTPISLAELLVNQSFLQYIKEKSIIILSSMKVFDPAMGSGIILLFAQEWLTNFIIAKNELLDHSFIEIRQSIFNQCIFGNDIELNAVKIYLNFNFSFCRLEKGVDISNSNFKNQDIIDICLIKPEAIFEKKFNLVITNPPFLALHSRFVKKSLSEDQLKSLRKKIPQFSSNRVNYYTLFLGLCLEYLIDPYCGVIGFVVDRSFLDLPSYSNIRKKLLIEYQPVYILSEFNYKEAVVDLALIIIRQIRDSEERVIWQKNISTKRIEITKAHFLSLPHNAFVFQKNIRLLIQIKERSVLLGNISSISCGLEYGGLLKTNFLSNEAGNGFYKVIDGSNGLPYPYILFWVPGLPNSFVRFDKQYENTLVQSNRNISKSKKKVLFISGKIDRFLNPKIFVRQTSPKFIATYDDSNFFALRNLHLIYDMKHPYTMFYILGILNSNLGTWIGECLNIIRKGGSNRYPQIRLIDLKNFPIMDIDRLVEEKKIHVKLIEKNVKKSLNSGKRISEILDNLWGITGQNFKFQRHFLQTFLNKDISMRKFKKENRNKIKKLVEELHLEIDQLNRFQILIDEEIYELYGINEELIAL